mmetsp:Transcript_22766/g.51315  ORF Transcript_22766/g.51315 Transcript_22766/m.51315 type:complete len:213 (-) Transcript_22766:767-1405(-)
MEPPVGLAVMVDDLVVEVPPLVQLTEVRHALQHHHLHLQHVVKLIRIQRLSAQNVSVENTHRLCHAQPAPLDKLRALLEEGVVSGVEEGGLVLGFHQLALRISVLSSKHLRCPPERVFPHFALRGFPGCLHSLSIDGKEGPGGFPAMSKMQSSKQAMQDHSVAELLCLIFALSVRGRCLPLLLQRLAVLERNSEADRKLLFHLLVCPGKEGK